MNLLILTGLATGPTRKQLGDEGLAALVLRAERLLRTGFKPDAAFLAGCSDYELEALAQAGDRLAVARATLVGAASQGLAQAAHVIASQDGGTAAQAVRDAEEVFVNQAAADRAIQRALGESSIVNAREVRIDQLQQPPEIAGLAR